MELRMSLTNRQIFRENGAKKFLSTFSTTYSRSRMLQNTLSHWPSRNLLKFCWIDGDIFSCSNTNFQRLKWPTRLYSWYLLYSVRDYLVCSVTFFLGPLWTWDWLHLLSRDEFYIFRVVEDHGPKKPILKLKKRA